MFLRSIAKFRRGAQGFVHSLKFLPRQIHPHMLRRNRMRHDEIDVAELIKKTVNGLVRLKRRAVHDGNDEGVVGSAALRVNRANGRGHALIEQRQR